MLTFEKRPDIYNKYVCCYSVLKWKKLNVNEINNWNLSFKYWCRYTIKKYIYIYIYKCNIYKHILKVHLI